MKLPDTESWKKQLIQLKCISLFIKCTSGEKVQQAQIFHIIFSFPYTHFQFTSQYFLSQWLIWWSRNFGVSFMAKRIIISRWHVKIRCYSIMYIPHGDNVVVSSNMAWYQFVHLWSGEAMIFGDTAMRQFNLVIWQHEWQHLVRDFIKSETK